MLANQLCSGTQDTSSNASTDWVFLKAPDSTGLKCKINGSVKTATVTPVAEPDSDPETIFWQVFSDSIDVTGYDRNGRKLEALRQ